MGDVNGDGKMDLIVADEESADVIVLLGKGNGAFKKKQRIFDVGNYPKSVVVADFSGDGKLDIATANSLDNTVSVLLGNGDGTFQQQMTFAVGYQPYAIAATDINGDGIPDLVTANYGSGDLSVLIGNGNGTFQTPLEFSVGYDPASVVAANVTGDGNNDLVVGGYADASVLLYIPTIDMTMGGMVMVGGTASYDSASVSMLSNGDMSVNIDGQSKTFSPGDVNGVDLSLGAGNDSAMIGTGAMPTMVTSGAGNDTINAANGGDNTLKGGKGDDIFFDAGDGGTDSINGGAGLNLATNSGAMMKNVYQVIDPTPPAPAAVVAAEVAASRFAAAAPADDSGVTAAVSDGLLDIKGTPAAEDIAVSSDGTHLLVKDNGAMVGSFAIAGLTGIMVSAKGGADTISVDRAVTLQTTLMGGGGADSITAGGGSSVLIGGGGSDTLSGGAGSNLLIPGAFATFSSESGGNDLLVGGSGTSIADFSYRTDNLFLSNDGKPDSGDPSGPWARQSRSCPASPASWRHRQ